MVPPRVRRRLAAIALAGACQPDLPAIDVANRIGADAFAEKLRSLGFSTVTAVFENMIANCMDNFGWPRRKATVLNGIFIFVMSLPCMLGFNVLSGVKLFGMDILGIEDFLVSNLILPVGALIFLLFCTYRFGWGFDSFTAEANTGKGVKMKHGSVFYFKYILPILLAFILVNGLIPK